jgi:hypothetical protein
MYPHEPDDVVHGVHGTPRAKRRRLKGPMVLAISASLLSASAVSTSASGLHPGTGGASHVAAEVANTTRAARGTPVARALPVPVHGAAADGTQLNGTFTLQRFRQQHGTLFAVGRLQGQLGNRVVSRHVSLPVTGATNDAPAQGPHGLVAPQQATPPTCSILNLNLAPIDLNLLGLHVFLDEVHLLIEAIPGAGNLLGNLLCAVAGLLNGGLLGGQLTNLLNAITGLLNALLAF